MNFELIAITPPEKMWREVHDNRALFGRDRVRQYPGSAHWMVDDILLRGPDRDQDFIDLWEDCYCQNYELMESFPVVQSTVLDLFHDLQYTELGRVIITRLRAGDRIESHIDEGPVPEMYTRYHYVIQGKSLFWIDKGYQVMSPGELWRVDVTKTHRVTTDEDRIHLIMDMA